ncbi:helix-turn-helix domain-containing protein [Nocardioides sp. LMS-CY]|uniref:Sugar diacid utilization regulator n=1 Tax=Nocardioides soli TaxID=1036020 RepID=A0A7W4VT92_9ACTN|nr:MULTISPECIES: helix-turn-helix domain-containing protein [Nocardioides]MBB3041098.1 sugar diacid utilization regulator [Nocardioides soli]QWF23584.1 helix-turn-helix domain-containing protein [Nocardioides sp. LMS-CY]
MGERITEDVKRVARAMLKEFDDLMTRIVTEVWSSVPAYAELMLHQSELRERTRENVHNVITCLLEDREPTAEELARATATGERRAIQGVSASSVIQSFRTAERALNEEYVDWCARMQVQRANIGSGRAAMIRCLDALEQAMLEAHMEIQRQVEEDLRLSEPGLFRRLATGSSVELADLQRLAVTMGIDDPERGTFVIVALASRVRADRAAMERHRHRFVSRLRQLFAVPVLSGTVEAEGLEWVTLFAMPWRGDDLRSLATRIADSFRYDAATDVVAAISNTCVGMSGLGTACKQAITTLESRSATDDGPPVHLFRDRLLEVMVHRDPPMGRHLVQRYLEPLEGGGDLLVTLRTHLEQDLSVRATAEALHVHKNTVVYRLRRIEERTGLLTRRPRDLAKLVLAVEAWEASGE